ncbi:hypothetical protein HPB50_015129 [Hyalomma asiaticum]|uniref:Uncharacterized protein n=1 Tax=Hyalomma asiaticum TaxID=266040 RepID=A0ACB7SYW0_HYAAI|nr:hypothetical protein HPB50_015129 [Hyalomma asiaticum]
MSNAEQRSPAINASELKLPRTSGHPKMQTCCATWRAHSRDSQKPRWLQLPNSSPSSTTVITARLHTIHRPAVAARSPLSHHTRQVALHFQLSPFRIKTPRTRSIPTCGTMIPPNFTFGTIISSGCRPFVSFLKTKSSDVPAVHFIHMFLSTFPLYQPLPGERLAVSLSTHLESIY